MAIENLSNEVMSNWLKSAHADFKEYSEEMAKDLRVGKTVSFTGWYYRRAVVEAVRLVWSYTHSLSGDALLCALQKAVEGDTSRLQGLQASIAEDLENERLHGIGTQDASLASRHASVFVLNAAIAKLERVS